MSQARPYPVSFTGTGGEYFSIWIVNIALTLVTLGVYSAWAKVRTERWFYGHTWIDNHAFSYLASPIQILKGRLIAFAVLAIYYLSQAFAPMLSAIMGLLFVVALPWIIVSALRFRARQSAWRGLRFDFTGGVGEAVRIYTLGALATLLTAGLILPYLIYRQHRFGAANMHYGNASASVTFTSGAFWKLYIKAFMFAVVLFLLLSMLFGGMAAFHVPSPDAMKRDPALAARFMAMMMAFMATFYLSLQVFFGYLKARTANIVYNGTQLAGPTNVAGFVSTQRARDLIWIYVSNLVLIGLSSGLFIPWAKVRLARYRAEHLEVLLTGSPEDFSAGAREGSSAVGNEMADVFDIDIGIA